MIGYLQFMKQVKGKSGLLLNGIGQLRRYYFRKTIEKENNSAKAEVTLSVAVSDRNLKYVKKNDIL